MCFIFYKLQKGKIELVNLNNQLDFGENNLGFVVRFFKKGIIYC